MIVMKSRKMGLTDKADVKCHKDGCTSGARWAVKLHLECPTPGGAKQLLSFRATLKVCDDHQPDAQRYILSDDNKRTMTVALLKEGYPEPDWMAARVEFEPIEREPITVLPPCDREGCSRAAHWRVRQHFFEIGRVNSRINAMANLVVCDPCRRETTWKDFVADDDDRKATFEWLQRQGVLLPDLDRGDLEFLPL